MRTGARRVLVGAVAGALLGAAAAVAYAQLVDVRSGRDRGASEERTALTAQQLTTLGFQVVNILRQLFSLA